MSTTPTPGWHEMSWEQRYNAREAECHELSETIIKLRRAALSSQPPSAQEGVRDRANLRAVLASFHSNNLSEDEAVKLILAGQAKSAAPVEPAGYVTPFEWGTRQTETVRKITRKPQPKYGFTAPVTPAAIPEAPPKWIDDPHDIEQGQMLNPEWLKLHGLTPAEARALHNSGALDFIPEAPPILDGSNTDNISAFLHAIPEAQTVEQAIQALKIALSESKGWMLDYSDAIIRDAIDRVGVIPKAQTELARGWHRYEKARKLSPVQWAELHRRNLAGEHFDDMIDALPAAYTPWPAATPEQQDTNPQPSEKAALWTLQGHRLATSGKAAWACRAFDPDAGEGGSWSDWRLTSYEPPRKPDRWYEVVALPAARLPGDDDTKEKAS